MTRHLVIEAGEQISYQTHRDHVEVWTIVEGEGEIVLDDEAKHIYRNESVTIPRGAKLSVKAYTDLHIIRFADPTL